MGFLIGRRWPNIRRGMTLSAAVRYRASNEKRARAMRSQADHKSIGSVIP